MPRDAPASTLEDVVHLPHGVRLALRRTPGHRRPFLLVHGLASNARMWDGVTAALAEQGHEVVAVDLRGHGRSPDTDGGYDTATAASDLASLLTVLGWTGDRQPVVAGQSWGGNVVLHLAATSGGVGALALVDGGWIRPAERFPDEDACWEALAPPRLDGMTPADLDVLVEGWTAGWPATARAGVLGNFVERPTAPYGRGCSGSTTGRSSRRCGGQILGRFTRSYRCRWPCWPPDRRRAVPRRRTRPRLLLFRRQRRS